MIDFLFSVFSNDIAIDVGTSNTLIYAKGKGILISEPSVVAVEISGRGERRVMAVGNDAKEMLGRTPERVISIKPIQNGAIADFEMTRIMLSHFVQKVLKKSSFFKPKIIICVSMGITDVEKRAVREAAESIGARQVFMVETPLAAAVGAGLPIVEPSGNLIVDIGGGTSEIAVISLGGIVLSKSIPIAGNVMDEEIVHYIKKKHNLLVGEMTAEIIKMTIGTAVPLKSEEKTMAVKGRDMISGIPKTITVSSNEIYEAISDRLRQIVEAIRTVLEKTPPEISGDIADRGLILSGGGAQLGNIDVFIRENLNLPVMIADDPLSCVAMGAGKILNDEKLLKIVAI